MIHSLFLSKGLNWLLNKALSQHICIFTLHRPVGPHGLNGVDLTMLEGFLRLLRRHGCEFISVDDLFAKRHHLNPAKNYVCFTVDDGYQDQAESLIPILLKYDARPTLFIITDLIDKQTLPWDAQIATTIRATDHSELDAGALGVPGERILSLKDKRHARRYLSLHAKRLERNARQAFTDRLKHTLCGEADIDTRHFEPTSWQRLNELHKEGLTVGTHTCSHSPLSTLSKEDIRQELSDSLAVVKKNIPSPSKVFCYPVGMKEDFDERAADIIKNQGFIGALISEPGYFVSDAVEKNPFAVPRLSLPATTNTAVRYTSWMEKLRAVQ